MQFSLVLLAAAPATAHEDGGLALHMTKDEALNEVAFPEADRIERLTLFLEPGQQRVLAQTARSPFDSRLLTVYAGYRDGQSIGYAFIDSAIVRSKVATSLVVLDRDGSVRQVRVLAWQEPPEYQPPQRWLDRLLHRSLEGDALQVGRDVDAISGATLSVRTLTAHVRRALAVHEVILDEPALVRR